MTAEANKLRSTKCTFVRHSGEYLLNYFKQGNVAFPLNIVVSTLLYESRFIFVMAMTFRMDSLGVK